MKYSPPIDPIGLRRYYSKTLKSKKIFLTGHSHLAWPDVVEKAQLVPVELAFSHMDKKWEEIFNKIIPKFQKAIASRIGVKKYSLIANAENTHEMIARFLSCFPWNSSTRLVSTDGEYYSLRRQLERLQEEGVVVDYVPTKDKNSLTRRIIDSIKPGTTAVLLSMTLFKEGYVLQDIKSIVDKAKSVGAFVFLDAYHVFNIRKLEVDKIGKEVFVVGGGYKYASGGEGAVWLKVPEKCSLRPKITGWFSEFALLNKEASHFPVQYGEDAQRFYGATRDISGICRQLAVFDLFDKLGLNVDLLQKNNLYQTSYLIYLFDKFNLNKLGVSLLSSRKDSERGPFIAIDFKRPGMAKKICENLWKKSGILTDCRGSVLRIGPALYNTQNELDLVMENLAKLLGRT